MIFDGPNRLIILEASDGDAIQAIDMFSEWKRWVKDEDGSRYPPALVSTGGEDIGAGLTAGSYFFVNTIDGWRIRPREEDHDVRIVGNLYPADPNDPIRVSTLGTFQVSFELERSQLTQGVETVADQVWDRLLANHTINGSFGAAVGLMLAIADGRLEMDFSGQRLVLYDNAGDPMRQWALETEGGEPVATTTGAQTKRGAGNDTP